MNVVFLNALLYLRPHQTHATSARAFQVAFNQYHPSTSVGHRRFLTSFGPRNIFSIIAGTMPPAKEEPRRSARLAKRDRSLEGEVGNQDECDGFISMKVTELKDILRQNGLNVSGNKKTLIDRLLSSKTSVKGITHTPQKEEEPTSKGNSYSKSCGMKRPKRRKVTPDSSDSTADYRNQIPVELSEVNCLPRTREMQLKSSQKDLMVIGVDEAGRGPLAG